MYSQYVLIVTEDEELIKKAKEDLEGKGFSLIPSEDAKLAIEMMSLKSYGAAIVDIDLKGLSSYDLLYRLGILMNSLPVIAAASTVNADNMLITYDFGVADIIGKNFGKGELLRMLEKSLSADI